MNLDPQKRMDFDSQKKMGFAESQNKMTSFQKAIRRTLTLSREWTLTFEKMDSDSQKKTSLEKAIRWSERRRLRSQRDPESEFRSL